MVIVTLHSIALLLCYLDLSHGQAVTAWWLQIGELRQRVVEAHRRCTDQQATIVQLHQRLLDSQQNLQANFPFLALLGCPVCFLKTSVTRHGSIKHRIFSPGLCQKRIACRTILLICIEIFWASQTYHSSTLSVVRACNDDTTLVCYDGILGRSVQMEPP